MICSGCGALHFDGAYVRCEDCRSVRKMETALEKKPEELFVIYGASRVKQPAGGVDIKRHRSSNTPL